MFAKWLLKNYRLMKMGGKNDDPVLMTVNVNGNSNDQEAPVNWRKDRVGRDRSICLFFLIYLNIFDQQTLVKPI